MATRTSTNTEARIRPIYADQGQFDDLKLIWIDEHIDSSSDCLYAKQCLPLIVDVLRTFQNSDECLNYILSLDNSQRVCVIVSGELSQIIIPAIVNLPQIVCLAIYCSHERSNQHAIDRNLYSSSKIIGVFAELDPLLSALSKSINHIQDSLPSTSSLSFNKFDDQKQKSVTELSQENPFFVWFQLLIYTLLHLPQTDASYRKMIEECRRRYADNQRQLTEIDEFERTYEKTNALKWYTRDTFVYRIINSALRTQNIDIILIFYPLIIDLHNQLDRLHKEFLELGPPSLLRVFRGQKVNSIELNQILRSKGKLISMNSFFSTGLNWEFARALAGDTEKNTNGLISILYRVHIDTNVLTVPYGKIGEDSQFPDEEEFLFSIGAIFRVLEAEEVADEFGRAWLITIQLVDEHHEQELNDMFEYYKTKVSKNSSLLTLAGILHEMDNKMAAERYYKRLRDELPKDHEYQPFLLNNLGMIAISRKRYTEALDLFEQVLNDFSADNISQSYLVITANSNIATVYYELGDFDKAEMQCRKVLNMKEIQNISNQEDLIYVQSNLANILKSRGNFEESLEHFQQALLICQNVFKTEKHPTFAAVEENLGTLYKAIGCTDKAVIAFEHALAIKKRCLPQGHYAFAAAHTNLGYALAECGNYAKALDHFDNALLVEKESDNGARHDPISLSHIYGGFALTYYGQHKYAESISYCRKALDLLPAEHTSRGQIYKQLGALMSTMGIYTIAVQFYQKAIAVIGNDEITLGSHLYALGIVYYRMNEYNKAMDSFRRSLEISERLLPKLHPNISKLYNEIGIVYLTTERFHEALDHFERANALQKQSMPEHHIDIARTINNISVVLLRLNRLEDALLRVNQAIEIAEKTLDHSHPLYQMIKNTAAALRYRMEGGNSDVIKTRVD